MVQHTEIFIYAINTPLILIIYGWKFNQMYKLIYTYGQATDLVKIMEASLTTLLGGWKFKPKTELITTSDQAIITAEFNYKPGNPN